MPPTWDVNSIFLTEKQLRDLTIITHIIESSGNMETTNHNLDCISKYHLLQDYCGFNRGLCVKEEDSIPENTTSVRLSVNGKASKLVINTDTPNSKVVFKVNGWIHTEIRSNEDGIAEINDSINFDRIHCAQIESDANLLNFSVNY